MMGFSYSILLLLFVVAIGCSSPPPPQRSLPAAAAPKKPPPKAAAEVPSLFDRSGDDYSYNPVGKRDPFMTVTEEQVVDDQSLPKTPLERYTIDQLKLTAIVYGITNPRALVQAPDDQSYIVRRNTRIGKNRGKISKITKHSLIIEEEYRDPTGKLVVNEQVLELRPEEQKPLGLLEKVGGD
jgi:type IV pilus assembly protein PilP